MTHAATIQDGPSRLKPTGKAGENAERATARGGGRPGGGPGGGERYASVPSVSFSVADGRITADALAASGW